jgi:hypothetical protein
MTTTQVQSSISTSAQRPGLLVTGLAASLAAAASTALAAGLAMALGVDFELPDGGESIPVAGFAVVTLVFSAVGLLLAAALRRWSRRPASMFVRVAVTLTVASLVPPFLQDASSATVLSLVILHVLAAAIVIPVVARRLAD